MTDLNIFTEEQINLIYNAVLKYQKNYGSAHSMYLKCEDVLNCAFPVVYTRQCRLDAVCDS
jgi:hypothetical protein